MTSQIADIESLKKNALEIRKQILTVTNRAGCGHPGGSLSAVEILLSLYKYKMNHKPADPKWEDRDRLIVSKGHVTPVVFSVLADCGYFPEEELEGFRTFGSRLQGHVTKDVPGVEFNTGSLGHGLSVANGMAAAARLKNKKNNVYCLMGDGEIQEGSVWEAAMTTTHHKLTNVCAIVDYNKVQECGKVNDIMSLEPLADKWRSFGWFTVEVMGHDFDQLIAALDQFDTVKDKPFAIIAHTVKGKGVDFMEYNRNWHGKAPNKEELKEALAQLKKV